MSKNQVAVYTPEILEVFKPEVLEVIRTSLAPNATDAEFTLFAHKAAAYKLDPFKNEIFFIKYGNQARIQFAAAAYLAKAREKDGFQAPDTQVVCENDEFKAKKVPVENGQPEWEIVSHDISFPRGRIIGAYSIAYRQGYRPVTVFLEKEHISHVYTGQNKDNWNKWEPDMIGKFVEQRALSKQFGLDLNDDESGGSAVADVGSYERKDITNEANALNQQPTPQVTDREQKQPPKPTPVDEGIKQLDDTEPQETADQKELKAVRKKISAAFKKLGISTEDGMKTYMVKNMKIKEGMTPTVVEFKALLKLMELEIEDIEQTAAELFDEDKELPPL